MSVDLNQCVPGQKVRLRNGRTVSYLSAMNDSVFPHTLLDPSGMKTIHRSDGRYFIDQLSRFDAIEVLPLGPKPTAASATPESPAHYGNSWAIGDFIREQGLSFHLGNAVKYICRCEHKGAKAEDLRKAIHYLQNELDHMEQQQ